MGTIPDWSPIYYQWDQVKVPYYVQNTEAARRDISAQYTTISRLDRGALPRTVLNIIVHASPIRITRARIEISCAKNVVYRSYNRFRRRSRSRGAQECGL